MKRLVFILHFAFLIFCVFAKSEMSVNSMFQNPESDSLINNSEVLNFPGVYQVFTPGMNRSDFIDVNAIQWTEIQPDTIDNQFIEFDLTKQNKYTEIENLIKKLAKSDMVSVKSASVLSVDGRKIYAIELGKGQKKIIFTAGIHAREVANTQFLLYFASRMINEYMNSDDKAINLLNKFCVVMIPCLNPDGYTAAIEGNMSIRNRNLFLAKQDDSEIFKSKSNANGVDINRNFPSYSSNILWTKGNINYNHYNTTPSIDYFAGHKLGSENETRVAMSFLIRNIPNAFRYIDLHSAGRLIYSGKPHLSDEFNNLCDSTGKIIRNHTRYTLYGLKQENTGTGTDGSITDFAAEVAAGFVYNEKLGRLAPPEKDTLVRKYNELKYYCSVNTVETLKTSRKEGFGLQHTSTPKMQAEEWKKYNLEKLFFSLITD